MPNLPEVHASALDFTRPKLAAVAADQWGRDSVCDGWTVRELVNHVVSGNFWADELMAGKTIEEVGDRLDGDVLGDDPVAAYNASATVAAAAFKADGAMEKPAAVSYGPVPGEVYCGHRFIDVLIHGWDVAESTGQDTNLPEALVEACWEVVEPQAAELDGTGAFGSDVDVPDGADLQTRLLAALGRRG
ncbi:MAG: TIGR03086 family protein [Actinobacteria bacterium]|nr:TIGR03086 family protein [Actinomycetota bacterium]